MSFVTNTNWQCYGAESTMSYLTQMAGLTVQNFVSAATGIALAIALIRGFARRSAQTVGNFWVDLMRCTLYVLLPLSIVVGLFLVWQGVPQNLDAYVEATTLEGAKQVIAQGPVASQDRDQAARHQRWRLLQCQLRPPLRESERDHQPDRVGPDLLDRRGAHQHLRPHGRDQRQGWAIFAVMGVLFLAGVTMAYWAEAQGNPAFAALGVDPSGGNMEGKEVRFGIANSTIWATATTVRTCKCARVFDRGPFSGESLNQVCLCSS